MFLPLLVCLLDHDIRGFIISCFSFPVGEKQMQAMRLLSCNEVSLPYFNTDFLHYHMQSAWTFNVSVTLPTLRDANSEMLGRKKKNTKDYNNVSYYSSKDLLKSSVYDQH